MRRISSHPVDEFILTKLADRKEEIPFNKDNWDALAARLDNSPRPTASPRIDKIKSFFNTINFTSKIFFSAFVLLSFGLYFMYSSIPNSNDIEDSSNAATSTLPPMPGSEESVSKILFPDININNSESDQDKLPSTQQKKINPKYHHVKERKTSDQLIPFSTRQELEATKLSPPFESIITNESSEKLNEKDQIIIEKDSLFIFW